MAKKNKLAKPQSQKSNRATKAPRKSNNPQDLRFVAVHEAGSAVVAVVLGLDLEEVVLWPHPKVAGWWVGCTDLSPQTDCDMEGCGEEAAMPQLIWCTSGTLAELWENPAVPDTLGCFRDFANFNIVFESATSGLTETDEGTTGDTPADRERKDAAFHARMAAAREKALALLNEHRQAVLDVTDVLMRKKRLSGKEVAAIVHAARSVPRSCPPQQSAPHSAIPAPSPAG
jgi:hypothetical protein